MFKFVLILLVFCFTVMADQNKVSEANINGRNLNIPVPNPSPVPVPVPLPNPPTNPGNVFSREQRAVIDNGKICNIHCENGMQTFALLNQNSQCFDAYRIPCYPYKCENSTNMCNAFCQSSADCAPGAVCNLQTKQCAVAVNICKDGFTILKADGTESSCSPYRCIAGGCKPFCQANSDCANGYTCVEGLCRN